MKKNKTKEIAKKVDLLRVQKTLPELNLTSVEISRVIDSEFAVFYDTKYKKLIVLEAENGKKLNSHRTAIVNIDTKKSFMMSIRKPERALPEIMKGTKNHVLKYVETLTTTKNNVETFLTNEWKMLLKVS